VTYHIIYKARPKRPKRTLICITFQEAAIVESARDVPYVDINVNLCTLCPLYRPEQGNIVGRKYINSCKFISPYGTSLADSTIVFLLRTVKLYFAILPRDCYRLHAVCDVHIIIVYKGQKVRVEKKAFDLPPARKNIVFLLRSVKLYFSVLPRSCYRLLCSECVWPGGLLRPERMRRTKG
jgi:hypothetical protein